MAVRSRKEFAPPPVSYRALEIGEKTTATLVTGTTSDSEELYPVTLSDGSVDRHGDTVSPDGWDLTAFKQNPVLLWGHDSRQPPIGTVKNVRVENGQLRGEMKFASSPRAKEGKALVDEKVLRTVSVGFKPVEWKIAEDRDDGDSWFPPVDFTKQELLELSVVSVPANANALIDVKAHEAGARGALLERLAALEAEVKALRAPPPPAAVEVKAPDVTPEEIAAIVAETVKAARAAKRMRATGRLD